MYNQQETRWQAAFNQAWESVHLERINNRTQHGKEGNKMKRKAIRLALAFILAGITSTWAVEDGLGTNHVRNLKVYSDIILDGTAISNWTDVASIALTNNSVTTDMIQDAAVTAAKVAAAVAGDGLTGGAGSALAVGAGSGITVSANAVAVDSSVIRTNGAQTIADVKTFTSSPVVPTPTTDMQASTKKYVDDKLSSSVASGATASDTLRWTGAAWTNTAGLTVDASSNVVVTGSTQSTDKNTGALIVEGGAGIEKNLYVGGAAGVTGNISVGGTAGITGITTLSATTASTDKDTGALVVDGGVGVEGAINAGGNLGIGGNTTLGNAGTDTITFTAKAASDLNMDSTYKVTGLAAPTASGDAATKLYVDTAINGLSWKPTVKAASTANLSLGVTLNAVVVDGITLAVNDRILVKSQTTGSQNGIYVVNAGVATRALDLDANAELAGAAVFVAQGTANAGSAWVCTTPTATVATDTLTFTQFASPGTYTAGDGLDLTGLQFAVDVTDVAGTGLEGDGSNNLRLAAAAAGDGLTGGAGSALAVGAGSGISVAADAVAVDSTVVRTTGDQTLAGIKTFSSSPVVPTPTTDMQASTKKYVDDKLSSSVASGTTASDTLRWTGAAWTNTAGLTVDASSNVVVTGSTQSTDKNTGALIVEGGAGIEKNLYVGGALGITNNLTVGGTAGITGITTLSATTASTDKDTGALVVEGGVGVEGAINAGGAIAATGNLTAGGNITATGNLIANGNTTLGNAGTDTITFTAKAASDLNMDTTYKVTGLATPSAATDAATKGYVDSAINGLSWKTAVKAASTANGTLATAFANGQTIDGVALTTGDRILIKAQTAVTVNGIYVVQASGAPVRAEDMNLTAELAGAAVFVTHGTANAGSAWVCTTPAAAIGSDDITFAQFASPGTYTAGDGITLTGLSIAANPTAFTGTGLEVNGGDIRIAAAAAGDGLTGGAGSALAVNTTVVRTTGDQTLAGVKTFSSSPVVPTPTTDMQASTKKYVDDKLTSSVANGAAASQTLRWTGTAWTNTAGMTVDATSNVVVYGSTDATDKNTGALIVDGGAGIEKNLFVGGALGVTNNLTVGGTAGISGITTLSATTASTDKDTGALVVQGGAGIEGAVNAGGNIATLGDLSAQGNTTLGNSIAADTVTITAKTTLAGGIVMTQSAVLDIVAGTGITATHIQQPYLKVRGDGGPIDLTVNPQIAAGTTGQILTLQGTSDTNTLKFDDGTGLSLNSGVSFSLKNGNLIQFIYDGSVWREMFRSVPAPL